MAEPSAPKPANAKYTSVIYVHGIGSQRRYEETSRLIDSLDTYCGTQTATGADGGYLYDIKPATEPLRSEKADTISYIRTFLKQDGGKSSPEVRYYEVYWAPIMAEQKSAWGIVKWMFSQTFRPIRTLLTPWRQRQRLRRAALVALYEQQVKKGADTENEVYRDLLDCYDEFEGIEALRQFKKGNFPEFLVFIGDHLTEPPDRVELCRELARNWFSSYRKTEIRNAVILLTAALALVLVALAVPMAVLALAKDLQIAAVADWSGAVSVGLALASVAGVGKVLSDYMGDVQAWATYEETDVKHIARNRVLDQSLEVLTHVLTDDACERVAIVSHSLGTSIAHDALLRLMRRNRAASVGGPEAKVKVIPIEKIEHFITMGSPIDKIEYFFESYASPSHRYKRVVEKLRGDIGVEPFTRESRPHIHWINFWDQGDLISGALQSPAGSKIPVNRVDNHQVVSYNFPSTAASHFGYFSNKFVIATIFKAVYQRKYSFVDFPSANGHAVAFLKEEAGNDRRFWFHRAALLIPWLAVLGLLLFVTGWHRLAIYPWMAAYLEFAVLFIWSMDSREKGQRHSISS